MSQLLLTQLLLDPYPADAGFISRLFLSLTQMLENMTEQQKAIALNAVFWPSMFVPGLNFLVLAGSAAVLGLGTYEAIRTSNCPKSDEYDEFIDSTMSR